MEMVSRQTRKYGCKFDNNLAYEGVITILYRGTTSCTIDIRKIIHTEIVQLCFILQTRIGENYLKFLRDNFKI